MILGPLAAPHVQGTVAAVAQTLQTFGFTAAQVSVADQIVISVSGSGGLRVTWDGTAPTTSNGMYIPANNNPWVTISGRQAANLFQMIRDGSSSVTVDITLLSV